MATTIAAVGDAAAVNADAQSVAARVATINPTAFIYLGDVYEDGSASDFTNNYDSVWGSAGATDLRSITLPVMGNHEWRERDAGFVPYWDGPQGAKSLPTTYPEIARYAVTIDGWRLIVINTEETGGALDGGGYDGGDLGGIGQGLIWLDEQLDLAGGKAIVFGHRGRWLPGRAADDRDDQDDLAQMWDVLEGRCAAYVAAHCHCNAEMPAVGGTPQLLAGMGGKSANAIDDASAAGEAVWVDNTEWAVLRITLDGDNATADWIAADDGSTLHSASLSAPTVPTPDPAPAPVDLSSVSRVQSILSGHNSEGTSISDRIELPTAPTSGNLLITWVGIDKDSGSDPAISTGWTRLEAGHVASVSFAVAYRIADGTAADNPTWTWTTGQWCAGGTIEYDLGDATFAAIESDSIISDTRAYARSCATAPLTGSKTGMLAVAGCSIDTAEGDGSLSWDNSFTEIGEHTTYLDGGGSVAERIIEDGSPVLPTVFGVPGDQIAGWTVLVSLTAPDTTAPQTSITSGPSDPTTETGASFDLVADELDCTFEVSLDGGAWGAPTGTPFNVGPSGVTVCEHELSGLSVGEHTLQARATDAADNTDATPASYSWTVEAPTVASGIKVRVNGEWVDAVLKLRIGGEWVDGTVTPA